MIGSSPVVIKFACLTRTDRRENARTFFQTRRVNEMGFRSPALTDFRRDWFFSTSEIAIGLAYLRQAAMGDGSAAREAVGWLRDGFAHLHVRNVQDRAELSAVIAELSTHLALLGEDLGELYGQLLALNYGKEWNALLSNMAHQLNRQIQ